MLATKTILVSPRNRKSATTHANEACITHTPRDLELVRELMDSKVLERLKGVFQLVAVDVSANDRAIRVPEVLSLLSISKSAWYDRLNPQSPAYDPLAPKPFKLGKSERSPSVWWHSEIIAYLEICAATSRNR